MISDLTLIRMARLDPSMVPLHLIARVWRLGDEDLRNQMTSRAERASCRNEHDRRAVRAVLVLSRRASIEALQKVGVFDDAVIQ
ncbi:MAG: hypothetical protein KI788_00605 [Mameliella sp.]|nr:hypothetical protein [Mameliella sp.]